MIRMRNQLESRGRSGLSLLEVILSIAILGGALTVIGHLYFLGYRSALQVRIRSEANVLVDSTVAELVAGVLPLESTSDVQIESSPGWTYSVSLEPSLQSGLFMATVSVKKSNVESNIGTSVSVVRFIPDPDYEPEEDEG